MRVVEVDERCREALEFVGGLVGQVDDSLVGKVERAESVGDGERLLLLARVM